MKSDEGKKIRLADYVADFLASHGIADCFTVVGGGAMHLNDAFGHHPHIHCPGRIKTADVQRFQGGTASEHPVHLLYL